MRRLWDEVTAVRRLEGYTLDDWESLDPREGRRIELVDGRLVRVLANGPIVHCHRLNGDVCADVVTLTPGNQQPVLVAGTISVTFDPAYLDKPRR